MIRVFLPALMIWALCFSVANCGSANVQSPQHIEKPTATPTPAMIKLTSKNPNGGFAMRQQTDSSHSRCFEISDYDGVKSNPDPSECHVYLNVNEENE